MLLLISGLPGSGKSTVARAYVAKYGGVHLSSDIVRGGLGLRGHYQPGDKQRVYATMLRQARAALEDGWDVVIDSTFYQGRTRASFEKVGRAVGVPVFWVEVKAAAETIWKRLQMPRTDSEANFSVYESIRDQFEPFDGPHCTLWTDKMSVPELVSAIYRYTQSDRP